jgi:hypothetical protein
VEGNHENKTGQETFSTTKDITKYVLGQEATTKKHTLLPNI